MVQKPALKLVQIRSAIAEILLLLMMMMFLFLLIQESYIQSLVKSGLREVIKEN